MAHPGTTLSNQQTMFDEVVWEVDHSPAGAPAPAAAHAVSGAPAGARPTLPGDDGRSPYWEFSYELNTTSGLRLTDVTVVDSQSAGSRENVFELVEFTDLAVGFTDGTSVAFNVGRAFSNPASSFQIKENGHRRSLHASLAADNLFQRGMKLTLVDNVLTGSGTCNVTLELSVVFRAAKNDFDPGGVPVALIVWPEVAFTWASEGASKRVKRFRGGVRLGLVNTMPHTAGMNMGTMANPANVASFFADSNAPYSQLRPSQLYDQLLRRPGAAIIGAPFGWNMVFDYMLANMTQEREIVGVYGPGDGLKYRMTSAGDRTRSYIWPDALLGPWDEILLAKADRQGAYDNIHVHAKMPDDSCHHAPIHAPFCGHSCIHMHWRWAKISSDGAAAAGWRYKGWSNPVSGGARAYSQADAPLTPPNQQVTVAICRQNATRYSDTNIINPAAPAALDALHKLMWYSVKVEDPNAGERQVIMAHGTGWAYRYANRNESDAVRGLAHAIANSLPIFGTETQPQLMDFFVNDVYPTFRYINGWLSGCTDQVPQGTWDIDRTQKNTFGVGSLPKVAMEAL
jgi:hypothetical protein